MSHEDTTSSPTAPPGEGATLSYARDGKTAFTWSDNVGLACIAVLGIAFLATPGIFSRWRSPRTSEWVLFSVIVFVASIVPLTLGIVALRRSRGTSGGVARWAWVMILGGAVNLLATPILIRLQTDRMARDYGVSHAVTRCASNLRGIAQACMLYSNDNHGRYPRGIAQMLADADLLEPEYLACPLSDDTPVRTVAELAEGGHVSYVYVGSGLTSACATAETVVAYERPTNHDNSGLRLHVLRGDGRIERVSKSELQQIIRELESGHNPPRLP
jgi:hypothetical protein